MPSQTGQQYYDAGYGIASVAISGTGITVVATTEAKYHGVSFLAGTVSATIKIYNTSAGTGNLIDVVYAVSGGTGWSDKYIPVMCKNGLTVSVVGTGASGVVFYSPKG